jgi:hypothetical protein
MHGTALIKIERAAGADGDDGMGMPQACTSVGGKPAMLSISMDGQVVLQPDTPSPVSLSTGCCDRPYAAVS